MWRSKAIHQTIYVQELPYIWHELQLLFQSGYNELPSRNIQNCITYAMHWISQYLSDPLKENGKAVIYLVKYL